METRKGLDWVWPSIVDVATAKKAANQGFWAAIFNAIVTITMTLLGTFTIWSLIDAVLFAAIAFGIYKTYRAASIIGLCLYILERVDSWISFGLPNTTPRVATFIILTLMFINSVRGTFKC